MSWPHSSIRPNTYLFLRLPTETLRLIEIKLNTIIDVGKLGSFPSNLLIGRPYYHTYELLERREGELHSRLRIVPPAELQAEAGLEDVEAPAESRVGPVSPDRTNGVPQGYDLLADDGTVILKNNRLTIDDASRQQLTQAEIEELKKSSGGKEVIEKILANHSGLDEKTAFARAKYMLRKHKKYLKRFSALPVDLGSVIDMVLEKEPARIMEMREESLGLINAWSHAHFSGVDLSDLIGDAERVDGKWLTVDDTGGLVVAGLAERLGLLYPFSSIAPEATGERSVASESTGINGEIKSAKTEHRDFPIPEKTNTITLLHPAVQPNLSILKYFGYDTSNPNIAHTENEHPLHSHLKPLSWLQLLHPDEDPTYVKPEEVPEDVLASWKSGKRGNYFKKRRRWERCKSIVDETREGGFEALVIATHMDPITILEHALPLVRGGGHVVIYSPTIEPLVRAVDFFSKERRAAYIAHLTKGEIPDPDDFPVDPRMLLTPTIVTSRIREWQVLPGRTHPLMTARGGAEGYVLTARKVIPLDGGVEARGFFNSKKRRVVLPDTDLNVGVDSEDDRIRYSSSNSAR